MPGIAGIVSREPVDVCHRRLSAMIDSMCHQPDYRWGTRTAPALGVYAGWVAHAGSYAEAESGTGRDGAIDLVFAGECFQDRAGGDGHALAGRPSASRGVLLEEYDRLGEDWFAGLNGQFSGVLIDHPRGCAWLFNDRYGLERLYVYETAQGTYFASEAKALLRVLPDTRSFDDEGVAQLLTFGCPLEGRTLFRGIRTMEGGSVWTLARGACRKRRYFTPSEWESQPALSADEFQAEFEGQFARALPRYLRAHTRLGISLTGGLDSRMIMARLPNLSTPPICYTFAGLEGTTVDARIGARVAAECGLEHRLLRVGRDFLTDYGRYLDRTVYLTDGTAGAVGAHEIYLSEQARQLAPIRLTGNFGSEILRSMSTFKSLDLSREIISPDFRGHVDAVLNDAMDPGTSSVSFAAFCEIPWKLFGTLVSGKSRLTVRTPYLDNDLVALAYRAPASVRQSTASALQLVEHANPRLATIPTDRNALRTGGGVVYTLKRLLAEVSFKLDYMHQEAPPRGMSRLLGALAAIDRVGLFGAHKYLPYRLWFQRELAGYMRQVLNDPATARLPFFKRDRLGTVADDHVDAKRNCVLEANAVLTLSAVDRVLLRGD